MRTGQICSVPGCRNLAEVRERVLCKEHRVMGGWRASGRPPRSGSRREVLIKARATELEVCAGFLEFNVNRLSVAECAAFIRKKARETREVLEEMQSIEGGKA